MKIIGILRGLTVIFLLGFTSILGTVFFLTPLLPLVVLHPKTARFFMDIFIVIWKLYCLAVYELVFQTKVVITGEPGCPEDNYLIIMNHRTRFDWLYVFSYQIRYGSVWRYTISLKNALKSVPGVGWAMQLAGYIFLQRKWEEDKKLISSGIRYLNLVNFKPQVLLFPEGTDFTPSTKSRSDKFAEQHGLPKYEYVLHPRTTGFAFFVQQMREENLLDYVIDLTVGYPQNIAQNELDILTGNFPREIHFHVEKHYLKDLPIEKEELEEWCKTRWARKEKMLQYFFEKKKFDLSKISHQNTYTPNENIVRLMYLMVFVFWAVFKVGVCMLLYLYPILRWFSVLTIFGYVIISKYTPGFPRYLCWGAGL